MRGTRSHCIMPAQITNSIPFFVATTAEIVEISGGYEQSFLVDTEGYLWATGKNEEGQLGDNTKQNKKKFGQVAEDAKSVSASSKYSLMVKTDGSVWATGKNDNERFGDESDDSGKFIEIVSERAKAVAAGNFHSLMLKTDGSVWATGANNFYQHGDGSKEAKNKFTKVYPEVDDDGEVQAVFAGGISSYFLKANGSFWAAGYNEDGRLGDGTGKNVKRFKLVIDGGVKTASASNFHCMVIKTDGSVLATGKNNYGQLGIDRKDKDDKRYSFEKVLDNGQAVGAGNFHSLVLKRDGSVWAAGKNQFGELGDGSKTTFDRFVIVAVGAHYIAAGVFNSFIVKTDGSLWAAGRNDYGQRGDGTTTFRRTFVRLQENFAPFDGACVLSDRVMHNMHARW